MLLSSIFMLPESILASSEAQEMVNVMQLNPIKIGLAAAISFSLLWLLCSALVMLAPTMMLSLSGDMMHMNLAGMGWHLTLPGVLTGVLGWFVLAGLGGWLLAAIYNRLV